MHVATFHAEPAMGRYPDDEKEVTRLGPSCALSTLPRDEDGWAFCWLAGSRLVAMLTVDRPRDLVQARRRIAEGAEPDPARLADPRIPVKSA